MHLSIIILLLALLGSQSLGAAIGQQILDKRIYGGYTAADNQAPYAASLLIDKGPGGMFVCGATIVSPEYVITAAHCLESGASPYQDSYKLTIGYDSGDKGKQKKAVATKAWTHPKYIIDKNSEDPRYDIAVIKIPAISGANTQRAMVYNKDVAPGATLLSLGWGGSEDSVKNKNLLRGANLIVGDNATCKKYFSNFDNNNGDMVCTLSSKTPGIGVCGGDSGGSLMAKDNNVQKLVGLPSRIIAFGTLVCGGANSATFFTHIKAHLSFVIEKSGLTNEYLTGEKAATPPPSPTTTPKPSKSPSPSPTLTNKAAPTPAENKSSSGGDSAKCTNTEVEIVTKVIAVTKTKTATALPWM
ncbi:hypothetical protein LPJ72_004661 [Coemansia sp. Benny D160-2]|nr:hypothetical protein LPJ72_004661 [Coemansia sp. Benny D160-2]